VEGPCGSFGLYLIYFWNENLEKIKMRLIYLMCLTMVIQTNCFCPNGCGCDDEKLETICFNTELEVRIKDLIRIND
jgi:hypothetical protein